MGKSMIARQHRQPASTTIWSSPSSLPMNSEHVVYLRNTPSIAMPVRHAEGLRQSAFHGRSGQAAAEIFKSVIGARLSGAYKSNPFFVESGVPIKQPRVLTEAQRAQVTP
jgi:hypothetical protein